MVQHNNLSGNDPHAQKQTGEEGRDDYQDRFKESIRSKEVEFHKGDTEGCWNNKFDGINNFHMHH